MTIPNNGKTPKFIFFMLVLSNLILSLVLPHSPVCPDQKYCSFGSDSDFELEKIGQAESRLFSKHIKDKCWEKVNLI